MVRLMISFSRPRLVCVSFFSDLSVKDRFCSSLEIFCSSRAMVYFWFSETAENVLIVSSWSLNCPNKYRDEATSKTERKTIMYFSDLLLSGILSLSHTFTKI